MYQLWPGQAQFMTVLSFIGLLWPWPSTYVKKCFKWHSIPRGQHVFKVILKSMHNCTSYGPDKLNIGPFWPLFDPWPWPSTYLKTCFKWHFSSTRATTLQYYFWNFLNLCINVQVMARTSSIYDHFDIYLTPVTLTFTYLKCFKWHFSSSRPTTVQNYYEIHA